MDLLSENIEKEIEKRIFKILKRKKISYKNKSFIRFYQLVKKKPIYFINPWNHIDFEPGGYKKYLSYRCDEEFKGLKEFLKIYWGDFKYVNYEYLDYYTTEHHFNSKKKKKIAARFEYDIILVHPNIKRILKIKNLLEN
jgi:hypothetical protein